MVPYTRGVVLQSDARLRQRKRELTFANHEALVEVDPRARSAPGSFEASAGADTGAASDARIGEAPAPRIGAAPTPRIGEAPAPRTGGG